MEEWGIEVASASCLPRREYLKSPGGTCGWCGITAPVGMEKHAKNGAKKTICPLCHLCLHLDVAGHRESGTVIWLPEISQAQLNVLFGVIVGLTIAESKNVPRDVRERVRSMFVALESRAEVMESIFGAGNQLFDPTHPSFLANQIASQINETDNLNLGGIRLLPRPAYFAPLIRAWGDEVVGKFPVDTWERVASGHA